MLSTLNPRVTKTLMALSLVILLFSLAEDALSLLTFLLGVVVSFPLTYDVWLVMEKNWDSLYRKFYVNGFHNRDMKLVRKSFRLTWWVVPWSIIIYSTVSFAIIRFNQSYALLLSFICGAVFIIALITNIKSRKYYNQISDFHGREKNNKKNKQNS